FGLFAVVFGDFSGCRRTPRASPAGDAGKKSLRIVTLTPSLTEIVYALGHGADIVGVDNYSDFPPEAKRHPRMGTFIAPNVEAITALEPDIVFLDAVQEVSAKALRSVGVKAIAMTMLTIADVHHGIALVGREIGADDAASALNVKLHLELDAAAAIGAAAKKRPRAL